MRKHPDHDAVLGLIEGFLESRFFRGWRVDGLHWDFQVSCYDLYCTNGDIMVRTKILTEWVDEALDSDGPFKRRKIKHALKEAFKLDFDEDGDAS